MAIKKTTIADLDAFIKGANEARKITLTDEDIKRINDLSREVEREEQDNENNSDNGIAAKKVNDLSSEINI
jgi:hypothetical protein